MPESLVHRMMGLMQQAWMAHDSDATGGMPSPSNAQPLAAGVVQSSRLSALEAQVQRLASELAEERERSRELQAQLEEVVATRSEAGGDNVRVPCGCAARVRQSHARHRFDRCGATALTRDWVHWRKLSEAQVRNARTRMLG